MGYTQAPECIQYALPSTLSPDLQCSAHLTPCHYVTMPMPLTLETTENQLANVQSQIQPTLNNGELSRQCLDAFLFVYCLQTYTICGQLMSGVYVDGGRDVCAEDCIQSISLQCETQEWAHLTNVIDQLRGNNLIGLPPLRQLQECDTNETTSQQPCLSLEPSEFIFQLRIYTVSTIRTLRGMAMNSTSVTRSVITNSHLIP